MRKLRSGLYGLGLLAILAGCATPQGLRVASDSSAVTQPKIAGTVDSGGIVAGAGGGQATGRGGRH